MSTTPVIIACFIVAAVALAHHAVAEHHVHRKYFWRYVRPDTVIPETRHDSMWHAMSHGRRLAVDAALLGSAGLLGLAWQLERTATSVAVIVITAGWLAWLGTRAMSRAFGERRHEKTWAAAAHHRARMED